MASIRSSILSRIASLTVSPSEEEMSGAHNHSGYRNTTEIEGLDVLGPFRVSEGIANLHRSIIRDLTFFLVFEIYDEGRSYLATVDCRCESSYQTPRWRGLEGAWVLVGV